MAGSGVRAELLLSIRSMLRAARGDLRGALADQLESAGRGHDDRSGLRGLAPHRPPAARHGRRGGRRARRRTPRCDWARVWGTPGYVGQALAVSGLILGGDEGLVAAA